MPAKYVDYYSLNGCQLIVMQFIIKWAKEKKKIIPRKKILEAMEKDGISVNTAIKALNELLKKRYIRRAEYISNKTFYVMLRNI